jgi:hypothetical protein
MTTGEPEARTFSVLFQRNVIERAGALGTVTD